MSKISQDAIETAAETVTAYAENHFGHSNDLPAIDNYPADLVAALAALNAAGADLICSDDGHDGDLVLEAPATPDGLMHISAYLDDGIWASVPARKINRTARMAVRAANGDRIARAEWSAEVETFDPRSPAEVAADD